MSVTAIRKIALHRRSNKQMLLVQEMLKKHTYTLHGSTVVVEETWKWTLNPLTIRDVLHRLLNKMRRIHRCAGGGSWLRSLRQIITSDSAFVAGMFAAPLVRQPLEKGHVNKFATFYSHSFKFILFFLF